MIIYEISATVVETLSETFEAYMVNMHIPDLLETGHFEDAEISKLANGRFQIRYYCANRDDLNKYLENDAQRLRDDFVVHFPAGVTLLRKIIES